MSRLKYLLVVCVLLLTAAACSGSKTPRLIASYPLDGKTSPPTLPPPAQSLRVYNTVVELQVNSVEQAAQTARELAERYNGYLAGWNTWQQDDQTRIQLVLEVPAPSFAALRSDLLGLGELVSESASSAWNPGGYGPNTFAEIILTLTPQPSIWPAFHLPSDWFSAWNPLNTFRQAFGVFWRVFGFGVDLLIWVLVLFGPFILLGLAIRWGLRLLGFRAGKKS